MSISASHSGKLSQTGRPNYNYPLRPTTKDLTVPLAPKNLFVTSPYKIGKADIRWDTPTNISHNNNLEILGVNVYRSTDNPNGPYTKINDTPITVLFYRDETVEENVVDEDAILTYIPGDGAGAKYTIHSSFKPIVTLDSNGTISNRVGDVTLKIDSGDGTSLTTPAFRLNGKTGEVTLISTPTFNHDLEQIIPPRLPDASTGGVTLTYNYLKHHVISELNQRIFYKVSTVARDPEDSLKTIETPLEEIESKSLFDIEALDWVWREAIRRNKWLLEQGGERVKVFTRKWMGDKCPSYQETYGQVYHNCEECYGTGFVGGYYGPIDIIIEQPESEKSTDLTDMGLHVNYVWNTWTSDWPLLNERDLIVRQNNERFLVGPVNYQGSRGAIYQQHFSMSYLDEGDIRYQISITGGEAEVPESSNLYREERKSDASPVITDKPEVPKSRQIRGRTVAFENITY